MGAAARRLIARFAAFAGALIVVALLAAPILGAQAFVVSAYPTDLVLNETTSVTIAVTNTGSGKNSDISCVQFAVRATFTVVSAAIVSIHGETSGAAFDAWNVVWPGGSRVTFKDPQSDYPLVGGQADANQAVFRIRGYATSSGQLTWSVGAHDVPDTSSTTTCSGTSSSGTLTFSVASATPTPTPMPSPTPTPKPTPTASPTLRPTPTPTPTATPRLTAAPTPTASPTPGLTARPSPTAAPSATRTPPPPSVAPPSQGPTPAHTPAPTSQATGQPTPAATPTPRFQVGVGPSDTAGTGGTPRPQPASGVDGAVSTSLQALPGGVLAWSYPALITAVPGILVLLAIAAQMVGALAWIPIVRRSLSGVGVGRRRRYQPGDNAR